MKSRVSYLVIFLRYFIRKFISQIHFFLWISLLHKHLGSYNFFFHAYGSSTVFLTIEYHDGLFLINTIPNCDSHSFLKYISLSGNWKYCDYKYLF